MASYRDKINQEKMATESGKIAFSIELMKQIRGLMPKRGVSVYIFDEENFSYSLELDTMAWYAYRADNYGNAWFKVLPEFSSYETHVKVLDAQPWVYI